MKKAIPMVAMLFVGIAMGWYFTGFIHDYEKVNFEKIRGNIEKDVKATLKRQDEAWNRGDIDAFMEDYLKSENLRFGSGGDINRGWQVTIERYKTRYPDKVAMGRLSFTDLDVDVVSATDAIVFGRWSLEREADRPNGLFTLHMKNLDGKWVIVSDHTSSAD